MLRCPKRYRLISSCSCCRTTLPSTPPTRKFFYFNNSLSSTSANISPLLPSPLSLCSSHGETCLHSAVRAQALDLVKLLVSCGGDLHSRGRFGTPKEVARDSKFHDIVSLIEALGTLFSLLLFLLWFFLVFFNTIGSPFCRKGES